MYEPVTFGTFCDRFKDRGREDQFSFHGKQALYDHLEEAEWETG